jgi:hypothetical protein
LGAIRPATVSGFEIGEGGGIEIGEGGGIEIGEGGSVGSKSAKPVLWDRNRRSRFCGIEIGEAGSVGSKSAKPIPLHLRHSEVNRTENNFVVVEGGMGGKGDLTASSEGLKQAALGIDTPGCGRVVQWSQKFVDRQIVGPAFDAKSSLTGSRQQLLFDGGEKAFRNGVSEAVKAGFCKDKGIRQPAFCQLPQARGDVSANGHDFQIRAKQLEDFLSASTGCCDVCGMGKSLQAPGMVRNKHIPRVGPLGDGGNNQAFGQGHGQVLQAVDSHIDFPVEKRILQPLREEALFKRTGSRKVDVHALIPHRADHTDINPQTGVCAGKCLHDPVGLCAGQRTGTGSNHKGAFHGRI